MKPKLRITLLDENLVTTSDRLVDQYAELLSGPTDKHNGPIKVEATLIDRETIDRFKAYLDRLTGNLPLVVKNKTTSKSMNPWKEIYLDIKKKETMEEVIEYLEGINFRWVNYQFLEELKTIGKWDKSILGLGRYQWLVRMTRQAKDPANDKFDFTFMVGIKFLGKLNDKILVLYKDKKFALQKPWKLGKNLNMKKKKVAMIFPQYMSIEERKQWRYMHRKAVLGKSLGPRESQFYTRYLPEVQNIPEAEKKVVLKDK